eukprot:CAMPEP_0202382268 /NCGR_PEP_ID=MMETSP1127-20130417/42070_1 /ASSEMBLY_ACC=CAM_ASM_000462 /TAXON_ID=3047 /ORGANISM="Dunaliella tertiolecta, Strain CCMP1320" /LENGTH=136 /DNA_ID=CAMNT_0048981429 /DNA_START=458 /DNA_END=868 /DNA_ORIENTATION=-
MPRRLRKFCSSHSSAVQPSAEPSIHTLHTSHAVKPWLAGVEGGKALLGTSSRGTSTCVDAWKMARHCGRQGMLGASSQYLPLDEAESKEEDEEPALLGCACQGKAILLDQGSIELRFCVLASLRNPSGSHVQCLLM